MAVRVRIEDLPAGEQPGSAEQEIVLRDVFRAYGGRPADELPAELEGGGAGRKRSFAEDEAPAEAELFEQYYRTRLPRAFDREYDTRKELMQRFADYQKAAKVVKPGVRVMYAKIDYPTRRPAYFRIEYERDITYGMLLYGYTLAYQQLYKLEDEDVGHATGQISSHIANRATSEGRFGIWGHCLEDLVYNGGSTVHVRADHILAEFSCDS